jgi:O-antigen/teichoic acid export membrane protein
MYLYTRFRERLRHDPRFSRILHGSLSGVLGRGLTLLISAVTLPLTLRYLGQLQYGIWVTVSTSVVMLSVLDLGIASTLNNFIAQAYAEDDREKAQRYFATAFWITVAIVAVLAPLVYLAWHRVDWGVLFHLSDPALARQAAQSVAVAGAFFLVSLPLTLASRVMGGYQQVHLANYFTMANSVFSLAAILTTVLLHGSLVMLMVAYSTAMLAGPLGQNVWLCLWQRPWIKPLPSKVTPGVIRRLFGQGLLFFALQLAGLVVFNSDNLVITHFVGAAAVTPYSVAWKLTQYASLLQGLLIPSLWPAISEAYHKRQMPWINSIYRSLERKTLIGVGTAALLIGLAGRFIIRVWVGQSAVPGRELLWLMALFAFIMSVTTNQALLLSATGRLRLEATVAVLAAAVNLLLSIHLVKTMGVEGVILSTILSFLIVMIGPQAWEVRRVLRGRYLPDAPVLPAANAHETTALS